MKGSSLLFLYLPEWGDGTVGAFLSSLYGGHILALGIASCGSQNESAGLQGKAQGLAYSVSPLLNT